MEEQGPLLSRRSLLVGAIAGGMTVSELAQSLEGVDSSLYGGLAALSQAYNVSGSLWVGPDSAKSTVTASSGRVYLASDTQIDYYGDSGSWVAMGVGTESNPVPEVWSKNFGGVYNAAAYPGSDLSAKIQNAQNDLPSGRGTIVVPPKPDGSAWSWDSDLSYDFSAVDYGLDLWIAWDAKINYPGTGWPLQIKGSGSGGINTKSQSRIIGGKWYETGSATGWLRLEDAYFTRVHPNQVRFDSSGLSFGLVIDNVDQWSESTQITGDIIADKAVNFRPASETGGTGSDSFHDTVIRGANLHASSYALRLAGVFQYVDIQATLQVTQSGANCLELDATRMDATTFGSLKFESPANPGSTAAINYQGNFDSFYVPLFLNARVGFGIDEEVRGGTANPLPNLQAYGRAIRANFLGGEVQWSVDKNGAINWNPQDVRNITSAVQGTVAYHDGTGAGNPEGPAFYDGTSWHPMDDFAATIS